MTVVVDASVALKWVLPEKDTQNALDLWDEWQDAAELVVAPPIFRAEVTNALHKRARRGDISHLDALEMLGSLLGIVAIREPEGLYTSALSLSDELDMSASYDALYLALAESVRCEVWTADGPFYRSSLRRYPRVRLLRRAA